MATEEEEDCRPNAESGVGGRKREAGAWYRGSDGVEDLDMFSWPTSFEIYFNTSLKGEQFVVPSEERLPLDWAKELACGILRYSWY